MTCSVARTARTAVVALLTGLAATLTVTPAQASTIVTPGNFTGYGFDQCLAPSQGAMDAWLKNSPFLAVGIYISGDSRACRSQPNLTRTWVNTQLRKGWRLLPITLGPQASCSTRFPRYRNDETINPRPGANGKYGRARVQGRAEAAKAVAAANALGLAPRSTLWYDIEGFDHTRTRCRESALAFLSGWTFKLHELNYVSGVYSSVGSGIKMLDDARVNRPGAFNLPDMIWLARWDGKANTSSSYIRDDGWRPGGRVKQYQGGHNETWGGVTINIDRNFLDVGKGSWAAAETHCSGTRISFPRYTRVTPVAAETSMVEALKCLLKEKGVYGGRVNGTYNERLRTALRTWQKTHGFTARDVWNRRNWMSLLVAGHRQVLKFGSGGPEVRRLQRALNAAHDDAGLRATGVFRKPTATALRTYQRRVGVKSNGIAGRSTWRALRNGKR
ncbi:MAG: glycoside hydrolase domain-containing protein [Nocardioides sp.]